MTGYAAIRERIERDSIEFVDFRVADLVGRFRHITIPAVRFTEELLVDGIGFDGSNYGFRDVAGSDMVLVPDPSTGYVEERGGERILTLIADICEARTGKPAAIDPRGIVNRAVEWMQAQGVADDILVSPEFEFYVFERALYGSDPGLARIELESIENCDQRGLPGLGRTIHSAYHAPLPQDKLFGLRCEICRQISAAGIPVKYHHHEVGSFGQQEIELGFGSLVRMADAVLVVKSLVRTIADDMGLSATFLPKPMRGEAGNGMHLHQFLSRDGVNLFRGEDGLSELALCYVGGLLTHGPSLMGLTNPSTNSYRRLVPGFEAPVHFVFGSANRSTAVRVPAYAREDKVRVELRTMDATCNPYLAFAAILLAGLDGIDNELNARELGLGPFETNIYAHAAGALAPGSLMSALDALEADHAYLLKGGIFSEEGLSHWIERKRQDCTSVAEQPHPQEFVLYYDL